MDINSLKKEQEKLAEKIQIRDITSKIKTIGGLNVTITNNTVIASIVVCDYNTFEILEQQTYTTETKIPYIPGFSSFRIAGAAIEIFYKLNLRPDILLVEGPGILHESRLGAASHIGILLNYPVIGVSKNPVKGQYENHKIFINNELRGFKIETKEKSNPIFVSPGHLVGIIKSLEIIKHCIRLNHKLPEPLHLAHKLSNKTKKELRINL